MNKCLKIVLGIMIIINAVGIRYHSTILAITAVTLGVVIGILDVCLKPTRRRILLYSISAVLLALLYIALDQEWINPLILV